MAKGDGRGYRGRGRGRGARGGGGGSNRGGGGGKARGGGGAMPAPGANYLHDELELNIRMFADRDRDRDARQNQSGNTTPRGRGRGGAGAGTMTPNQNSNRARGRGRGNGSGYDSPRGGGGRGRGSHTPTHPDPFAFNARRGHFGIGSPQNQRGYAPSPISASARGPPRTATNSATNTLSGLLYQERPLLRPIKFVPSVLTKVLFREEEGGGEEVLLRPGVEDVDETEQSHIPTAERVFRVFSGATIPTIQSSSSSENEDDKEDDEEQEEIAEIDFDDLGKLFNSPTNTSTTANGIKKTTIRKSKLNLAERTMGVVQHEKRFTGFYMDPNPSTSTNLDMNLSRPKAPEDKVVVESAEIAMMDVDVDGLTKMVEDALSTTDEPPPVDVDVDVEVDMEIRASHTELEGEGKGEGAVERTESISTPPTTTSMSMSTSVPTPTTIPMSTPSETPSETIPIPIPAQADKNPPPLDAPGLALSRSSAPAELVLIPPHRAQPEIVVVDVPLARVDVEGGVEAEVEGVLDVEVEAEAAVAVETAPPPQKQAQNTEHEQPEPPVASSSSPAPAPPAPQTQDQELFCIDVQPSPVPAALAPSGTSRLLPSALRGADEEDDDIIVYVAPHPRKVGVKAEESVSGLTQKHAEAVERDTSHFEPYVRPAGLAPFASSSSSSAAPAFASFNFSFSQQTQTQSASQTPSKPDPRLALPPVSTPRQAKAWQRKRGGVKAKRRMNNAAVGGFGAFGAMREEALLHTDDRDPRRDERRRGDSDLEWGDEDEDGAGEVDEVRVRADEYKGWRAKGKGKGKARDYRDDDDEHGMDVDSDLAPGMDAMKRFVGGLLGSGAGRHTTMDDLRVEDMVRMEDELGVGDEDGVDSEDDEESSEDEEEEDVLAVEEAMLISESLEFEEEDDEDDDSDEEEDEQTPRTSFQARLERLRSKARSRKVQDTSFDQMDEDDDQDEDEDDDMLRRNMTWADQDEDFIQEIENIFDDNEDVLTGKDRKLRKALFRSIRDGTFDELDDFGISPAKKRKDIIKGLPRELQDAWEKDRQKKAEYKRARAAARLEAAADPLTKKKGGKKGRKAMLAAAKLDPTITVIPNRVIDMTTLVQQIRRFVADLGGPSSMSLPPTNKETRKNIHEMALAFHLKSLSKGRGDSRYTTLSKTSRSGLAVDERKVARIVRRSGGMGARGDSFIYDKTGKGPSGAMPRHREGDEVGKAAPKLTESNVGFRMLAMMGWSEGDRIGGATGGLDAPLTAIIKTTKLGLGATK